MTTYTHERKQTKRPERGKLNGAKFYGAAVLAAAGIGAVGVKKIESNNHIADAKMQLEADNTPHNIVSLDGDTTIFGVASAAVDKGYLNIDKRQASDMLTDELNKQMHENGQLAANEQVDLGKLPAGTPLEVPASWAGIGKPEEENGQPRVEIGTAAYAEVDPATGQIVETQE